MSNVYCIYLRKSRADMEAEARGEGETLARHRRALTELAEQRGLNVAHIYEEIVTGDTIAARPQMQALLSAVESGEYAGVIVNDADRLARGDSIDQGIVKQAFYSTNTLIITPFKTFNPADESDEDFFDFSLFMARFEYRKIKQRMQTGRARSAAEGNYMGARVPYGFEKVRIQGRKGWTLVPIPDKAEIVRMIFRWYAYGDNGDTMGADMIARRLNNMGERTNFGCYFRGGTIRAILNNPEYIGTSTWNKHVKHVRASQGQRTVSRVKNPEPICVENAHEAIIDMETWEKVRQMFANHAKLPKNSYAPVANALAGMVKCAVCGKSLLRKPGTGVKPDVLRCKTYGCPATSIYIPIIERAILEALESWVVEYDRPANNSAPRMDSNVQQTVIQRQIDTINAQMARLHDLLEQGIYSPAVFIQRRDELNSRMADAQAELDRIKNKPTTAEIIIAQLPQIKHVLEAYPLTDDLQQKNMLLRSVVSKVVYHKTRRCTKGENPADHMKIEIYPVVPSEIR